MKLPATASRIGCRSLYRSSRAPAWSLISLASPALGPLPKTTLPKVEELFSGCVMLTVNSSAAEPLPRPNRYRRSACARQAASPCRRGTVRMRSRRSGQQQRQVEHFRLELAVVRDHFGEESDPRPLDFLST